MQRSLRSIVVLLSLLLGVQAPSYAASSDQIKVSETGRLQVEGTRLTSAATGETIRLAGMSFFWSNWAPEYYNAGSVNHFVSNWNASLVRAAYGVEDNGSPYAESKVSDIETLIEAAIAADIYVLVDWHSHGADKNTDEAVAFFTHIAKKYGHLDNIIYELYNEPIKISWSDEIKPYAEEVIAAIRAYDPDNLITVGTPWWSQRVDEASLDPIADINVAYAFHFYVGLHGEELRARARTAMENGAPLFVTEWGVWHGDNMADRKKWIAFMDEHDLSWAMWSVHKKVEPSSILKAASVAVDGNWEDNDFTEIGLYARDLMRQWYR